MTALAFALVLAVGPASGAESRGDALAEVSLLGGQVAWAPLAGAERLLLRVSGPGMDFAQRFDGAAPVFNLSDERGAALADGVYKWELREEFAPVNDRVRDPRNGRDSKGQDAGRRVEVTGGVQSGTFTVRNGAVVDSGLVEFRAEDGTRIESAEETEN